MAENAATSDEISLSDIFWRLWAARGVIVLVPLLAAAAAALLVGVVALFQSPPVTYLVNLRNIENQRYPNGAAFSPQDLLIPEILAELRQRFNLPQDANLREAISVTYDSPIASGIARLYQQRLAARNLTQAEIAAINQSYLEELQAAMRSSLRVSVNYRALGVDGDTGKAIATALPELWTTIYTTKFRIFTDRRIADLAVTRTQEDLATSASILVASARIEAMRAGLTILQEDNRLSLLQTDEGMSPADLDVELRRFAMIWFHPIKASRLQQPGDAVAGSYVSALRLDIAEKRRRVEAYDTTLAELRTYQSIGQLPPQVTDQPAMPGDRSSSLQVGETALSEIVQLAEQASFANFVQETLRNRRLLMFEISELTRELDLALIDDDAVVTSAEFRAQAAAQLQDLTQHYSELVRGAEGLLRDRGGDLFQPALGPLVGGSFFTVGNALAIAVAALAAGLLTVVVVLLRGSIRPRVAALKRRATRS